MDNERPARRRGILFWSLATLGLLAAGLLAGLGWIHWSAARDWAAFRATHEARLAKLRAVTGERPPLLGDPTPGNAWEDYEPALASMRASMDAAGIRYSWPGQVFVGRADAATTSKVRDFLPSVTPALDRIRTGARRNRAQFKADWERGAQMKFPPIMNAQVAGDLLLLSSRQRREAGDASGALDDLGTVVQLGVDVAAFPSLTCLSMGGALLKAALSEIRANPGERARLGSFLAYAAERLPRTSDVMDAEGATLAQAFINEDGGISRSLGFNVEADADAKPIPLWYLAMKRGFSVRRLFLDTLDDQRRLVDLVRRGESLDNPAAEQQFADEARRWASDSGNALSKLLLAGLGASDAYRREVLARICLLQAGDLVREGRGPGDPSWPVDPFSLKPLGFREEDGVVRIWSVSRDGVDSPTGSWSATLSGRTDIVLEIRR